MLVTVNAYDAHADNFKLFNTFEKRSSDISSFTKWTGALSRYKSEQDSYNCPEGQKHCIFEEWKDLMATLKQADKITQIYKVNSFINNIEYREDTNNVWQATDYWASPKQFFTNAGDCEDYAIAKYVTLKKLGFNDNQLRLVIVEDKELMEIHAVLAVHVDNAIYILDNQNNFIIRDKAIKRYTPIYSINATSWWKHHA